MRLSIEDRKAGRKRKLEDGTVGKPLLCLPDYTCALSTPCSLWHRLTDKVRALHKIRSNPRSGQGWGFEEDGVWGKIECIPVRSLGFGVIEGAETVVALRREGFGSWAESDVFEREPVAPV